jgi:glycine/D-amino acid oxidase-like deaminating enzyme
MSQLQSECLIIGGGIAGLMIAHQLEKAGQSFLLVDEGLNQSSSKVAAGMFNPISGKRMTVNWKVNELLQSLQATFVEMENKLGKNYLVQAEIVQAFGNTKESNDFSLQLEKESFSQYINASTTASGALNSEFGVFGVKGSGWVKTKEWIADYHAYLLGAGKLIYRKKSWDDLKKQGEVWQWHQHSFKHVISCDGFECVNNPYFNWLPFKLCKGEVLHINCAGLDPNLIIKKGVYLVHQEADIYKVGATYEWNFEDSNPTEAGKESLLEKLNKLLTLPYQIISHEAGIRPTTRDRAAILGEHPSHKNLFCFNGLGTKGILQAPFLAQHLATHILQKTPLESKVDIARFNSFYTNSQF